MARLNHSSKPGIDVRLLIPVATLTLVFDRSGHFVLTLLTSEVKLEQTTVPVVPALRYGPLGLLRTDGAFQLRSIRSTAALRLRFAALRTGAPFKTYRPFQYQTPVTSEVSPSLTGSASPCTLHPMKLSISEARKRLPELVRQFRKDAGAKVEITVRDEVVAELRAALPEPEPGAAAKKLAELMRRLPKHRGRKTDISAHVKEHLYGSGAKSR